MRYGKKIRILLLGLCGSAFLSVLLVLNCAQAASEPEIADKPLLYPHFIKGTQLVIQGITGYEGAYMEDGSNEEVADVAALVLCNMGNMVDEVKITVVGEKDTYVFYSTKVPANSFLVILEKDKKEWAIERATTVQCVINKKSYDNAQLQIREEGMGTLVLTNTSNRSIENITIYHKSWVKETAMYFGGITHETYVERILPGETVYLCPQYYAVGSSKIILITKNELS